MREDPVAGAADGVDQLRGEGVVDLPPQVADVDVDDVGGVVKFVAPNVLGDHAAGEDLVGVPRQVLQERVLLGRKVDARAPARHFAGGGIKDQVSGAKDCALGGRLPAGQRADSRRQLGEGEWLHQIVVRPAVQPAHAVLDGITRRENEDGRARSSFAQCAAHLDTVANGEHDIEHDHVEFRHVGPV